MVSRVLLTLAVAGALAQGQAAPAFEVASVKLSAPITDGKMMVAMRGDPGQINYTGVPLRALIARAYKVKDYQISGLDGDGNRYDVVAKLPPNTPNDQVPLMLQTLLAERFKLALHREQKDMPVYALVVGKGGLKMKEVEAPADRQNMVRMGMGHLDLPKARISVLADVLSRLLDRPVLDMSGTTGAYDIKLDYAMDENILAGMKTGVRVGPGGDGPGATPSSDSNAPSIFTALQEQLGLKLEARKAPVEILVIDHAEKTLTEN